MLVTTSNPILRFQGSWHSVSNHLFLELRYLMLELYYLMPLQGMCLVEKQLFVHEKMTSWKLPLHYSVAPYCVFVVYTYTYPQLSWSTLMFLTLEHCHTVTWSLYIHSMQALLYWECWCSFRWTSLVMEVTNWNFALLVFRCFFIFLWFIYSIV